MLAAAVVVTTALYIFVTLLSVTAQESYFLFITWSLIGLILFHRKLRPDSDYRFGDSAVVWIALLAFVMFMSFVWMEERFEETSTEALSEMRVYYELQSVFRRADALMYEQKEALRAVAAAARANNSAVSTQSA